MTTDPRLIRVKELESNPIARVPICFALDVSGSMAGVKILELNLAMEQFIATINDDDMAKFAVEVSVVTFGEEIKLVNDFSSIERLKLPKLVAGGETPMGQAVGMSLDILDKVKRVYLETGTSYYQPWLVLMTDGKSTDDIGAAAARVQELVKHRKLTVFPIAIGVNANLEDLGRFSPNAPPMRMESTDLRKFFQWLSASVTSIPTMNPGDEDAVNYGANLLRASTGSWSEAFGKSPRKPK